MFIYFAVKFTFPVFQVYIYISNTVFLVYISSVSSLYLHFQYSFFYMQ